MLDGTIHATLEATVLAVGVWLICRTWRPRPASVHLLWLVVLVKLLLPPILQRPSLPFEKSQRSQRSTAPVTTEVTPHVAREARPEIDLSSASAAPAVRTSHELRTGSSSGAPTRGDGRAADLSVGTADAAVSDGGHDFASTRHVVTERGGVSWRDGSRAVTAWTFPWKTVLMAVWGAGALGMLLTQLFHIAIFTRRLGKPRQAPPWLLEEMKRQAGILRVSPPPVHLVANLHSPLVWCFGRPRLMWPAELTSLARRGAARGILIHELAHLRRKDHWTTWLTLTGSIVHWWNPLFWLVQRQIDENADLSCDAWVIALQPDSRREYVESLISVSERASSHLYLTPALPVGGQVRRFERRMKMIMHNQSTPRRSVLVVCIAFLVACLSLPTWSKPRVAPSADRPMRLEPRSPQRNAMDAATAVTDRFLSDRVADLDRDAAKRSAKVDDADVTMRHDTLAQVDDLFGEGSLFDADSEGADLLDDFAGEDVLQPADTEAGLFGAPATPRLGNSAISIQLIRLKHRSSSDMKELVSALMAFMRDTSRRTDDRGNGLFGSAADDPPPTIRLAADAKTRTLVARGTTPLLSLVEKLVKSLDVPKDAIIENFAGNTPLSSIRFFSLKARTPQEMITLLRELRIPVHVAFPRGSTGEDQSLQQQSRGQSEDSIASQTTSDSPNREALTLSETEAEGKLVAALERTMDEKSNMVLIGKADALAQAEQVIRALDSAGTYGAGGVLVEKYGAGGVGNENEKDVFTFE